MLLYYSKKDGLIELIEIDIEITTLGKNGFWAKTLGVKDSALMKFENISLFISKSKLNENLGGDDDEPRIKIGGKYKLILKRIT